MTKKAFLICPVRGHDPNEAHLYVKELESKGFKVHWPPRDTDQDDPTGYRICQDNLQAIKDADVVFFIWDGKSQGCIFDLGMAFTLNKRVVPLSMPELKGDKSFQDMVDDWAQRMSFE